MLKLELSYDNTEWFSRLGGKYTDKRFYTYTNDAKVPAFWLYSLSAGYKPKSFGMLKDISVQLNVENLFNKQYFSSMGTNGFDVSDPKGSLVTLQAGAPRQLFLSFSAKM